MADNRTPKQREAALFVTSALAALKDADLRNGIIASAGGYDAHQIAKHLGLDLRSTRNLLGLAERAGAIRSHQLRCEGRGRKGTRQRFMRKFYQVVR